MKGKERRFHNCVSLNNTKCPESLTIIYYHIFLSSLEQGTPERMNSFFFFKQFIVSSFYLKFMIVYSIFALYQDTENIHSV